jgi:hypothetical protein
VLAKRIEQSAEVRVLDPKLLAASLTQLVDNALMCFALRADLEDPNPFLIHGRHPIASVLSPRRGVPSVGARTNRGNP